VLRLYSAEICPFAQRTRALLAHLSIEVDHREIDLGEKPEDFSALSPTGKVPLLVDGDTLLYESQIIAEYLAETHGFEAALPTEPHGRARVRLAAKQFDDVVLPAFYRSLFSWGETGEPGSVENRHRVSAELDEIEETIEHFVPQGPSLAAFHYGPFWQRMDAVRALTSFAEVMLDTRPSLRERLGQFATLDAIRATALPADALLERYRDYARAKARAARG
jgi:glutathione S-transferase